MEQETINKFEDFSKEITYRNNKESVFKYYIIIDDEIALLNDANRLGYKTKEDALKAFASKIRWWLKYRIGSTNPYYNIAASTYINYMIEQGRLQVMTMDEYKEYIKNIK